MVLSIALCAFVLVIEVWQHYARHWWLRLACVPVLALPLLVVMRKVAEAMQLAPENRGAEMMLLPLGLSGVLIVFVNLAGSAVSYHPPPSVPPPQQPWNFVAPDETPVLKPRAKRTRYQILDVNGRRIR